MRPVHAWRADLACGFGLLTRLPVGWLVPPGMPYRPGRAVWTYPLAGLVVGGVTAGALWIARRMGVPPLPAAAWSVAAAVLFTGGLHEDGLADTADGFGGGGTVERRLEIMRDSRIGSYGAVALVLSLGVRVTAIAALPPHRVWASLLVAGALSRASMLPVLALLPPARADGLGRMVGRVPKWAPAAGSVVAVAVALACLPPIAAAVALAVTALVALAVAALAHRWIRGQTGDVLGACCGLADCVLLTLLAAR